MGAAVLGTLFSQSAVGLHVLDTHLRVVQANTLSGVVPDEHLVGRYFTDAYHVERPDEAEHLLRKVLDTGVAVHERVIRGRPVDSSGPSRRLMVSVHRLNDTDGRALGLLATVVDVNEREKARVRTACLTAVRTRVGRSLDVAATCEGLVEAAVPAFADFAVVEVVDDILRGSIRRPDPWGPMSHCAARPSAVSARTATGAASSERCAGCPTVRRTPWPHRTSGPASSGSMPGRHGSTRTPTAPG